MNFFKSQTVNRIGLFVAVATVPLFGAPGSSTPAPSPSSVPAPTATATAAPTPTAVPTVKPSPSTTPSTSATPTPTPKPTQTPSTTPPATPSATPSPGKCSKEQWGEMISPFYDLGAFCKQMSALNPTGKKCDAKDFPCLEEMNGAAKPVGAAIDKDIPDNLPVTPGMACPRSNATVAAYTNLFETMNNPAYCQYCGFCPDSTENLCALVQVWEAQNKADWECWWKMWAANKNPKLATAGNLKVGCRKYYAYSATLGLKNKYKCPYDSNKLPGNFNPTYCQKKGIK